MSDAGQQNERRACAEADWKEQQRGSDSPGAVNATREPDLYDEPGDREIGANFGEQVGNGFLVHAKRLGSHAELLIDDRRTHHRETHDRGEDAQLPGLGQQTQRLASSNSAILVEFRALPVGSVAGDAQNDRRARRQDGRADEEQVVRSELSDRELGDRVAERTAQAGPAADQAEQPLGLACIVDVVGQRPELTDEKNPENLAEDVERDRDPHGLCLQQDPEHTEQDDDGRLGQRNDVLAGKAARGAPVQVHEDADEDRRPQEHPR